jgi:bifunctional non-homologous end joining protein LigD
VPARQAVEVEGRRLELSNLDKVLYPAAGFTKAQVIDYYTRIAPAILPHLCGRPVTRVRFPNGVEDKSFFEKQCPDHRPDWVRTVTVPVRGTGRFGGERREPRDVDFCLVEDLPTLVWLANLAALELHTSLALAKDLSTPTLMVFDLDPGPPAGLLECARVGLWLRELLDQLGLQCVVKTSGKKGMQVYVPLNRPVSYARTKPFAQAVARHLEGEHPGLVVSKMKKDLRGGKVFVDWQQNVDFKTTVCAYSLRAQERPTVSTPLRWDEVEQVVEREDPELIVFDASAALDRAEREGDLFAPALGLEQELPELTAAAG